LLDTSITKEGLSALILTKMFANTSKVQPKDARSLTSMKILGPIIALSWIACSATAFQPAQSRPTSMARLSPSSVPLVQRDTPTFSGKTVSSLFVSTSESAGEPQQKLDVGALGKYVAAIATQMGIFYGAFRAADWLVSLSKFKVPFAVNCVLFWFIALKSRVTNPLNNTRPNQQELEIDGAVERKLPSWTPPGVTFPIMWILIIGPIRALTTAMVYSVTGSYANTAILSLMLHLSIGDVWNTINNVERRYGASVIGVCLVWLSKAHAAYQYGQVSLQAGRLLCLPLLWLSVATALITRTWQLNPDQRTGKPYPLYPVQGQGETSFSWFAKK
jgi:benzodiazapine receptor